MKTWLDDTTIKPTWDMAPFDADYIIKGEDVYRFVSKDFLTYRSGNVVKNNLGVYVWGEIVEERPEGWKFEEKSSYKPKDSWDESIRGPKMSGSTGNRIWKYQMPVAENFTMRLPENAQIIRMAGENGYLWLWAVVDTQAPLENRKFSAFKAGGEMPDDISSLVYVGMASIYIQQELMLYIFEDYS